MSKLYFECPMGASGDMICGALIGLTDDTNRTVEQLNSIGFNGVKVEYTKENASENIGHFSVFIDGAEEDEHCHHHGVHAEHIFNTIDSLNIEKAVKDEAKAVYNSVLNAESIAHDMPVDKVHLHEVGNTDAICDIVCACYLMNELNVTRLISSAVNTGSGKVMTAHGELDVPAPATKILLEGVENYKSDIQSELCTPTGAALIKHFAKEFGEEIPFTVEKKSAGSGRKKFDKPNCLYAYIGE